MENKKEKILLPLDSKTNGPIIGTPFMLGSVLKASTGKGVW